MEALAIAVDIERLRVHDADCGCDLVLHPRATVGSLRDGPARWAPIETLHAIPTQSMPLPGGGKPKRTENWYEDQGIQRGLNTKKPRICGAFSA